MKHRLLAVVAAATLVFAGCGGDDSESDSNQALSYDAVGAAIGDTCQTYAEATAGLAALTGDPKKDSESLGVIANATEEQLESTRDLEPPAELQAAYDEYIAVLVTILETYDDAQTEAQAGDAAEYQRVLETFSETGVRTEGRTALSKLGASECLP